MAELLVEIGFEEMPAPWLPGLAEQLRTRFVDAAAREFLEAKDTAVAWTPRRLVLRADLPARQADREEPVWGPALKVAKDASGAWTAAAQGFAKKNGVAVEALLQKPKDEAKPGELNLLFVRKVAGRATGELVPGLLSVAAARAGVPEADELGRLARGRARAPFRSAGRSAGSSLLFDKKVVPFSIYALEAGAKGALIVESGSATRGHRFLPKGRGQERPAVSSYAELRETLRERFVLVEPEARTARIDEGLLAAAVGRAFDDHGLRDEWRDLVEYPTVLVGQVPEEFSGLPSEVLETVLVHHQKYISLGRGRDASTASRPSSTATVPRAPRSCRGMERVVVARLRDASFFLAEDRKRPLGDRVADLAGVTFHQGLGTYKDKSARMVALVEAMGRRGLLAGETLAAAKEAARLAKADLVTLMVREFPELQGVMGGIYLAGSGTPADVATAVRYHYQPVAVEPEAEPAAAFAGKDDAARVFAAVALADKLDTLCGYFGLGESPTGSRDPYGLRRAGQGAVRAVLDFWRPKPGEKPPDLEALVADAVQRLQRAQAAARRTSRRTSRPSCSIASRTCSRRAASRPTRWRRSSRRPARSPIRSTCCGASRLCSARAASGPTTSRRSPRPSSAPRTSSRRRRPARRWTRSCSRPTPSAGSSRRSRISARTAGPTRSACARWRSCARRSPASSTTFS